MSRHRYRDAPDSTGAILAAAAAGALAGLALGMLAAQKLGGLDGVRARLRSRRGSGARSHDDGLGSEDELESMRESAGESFAEEDDLDDDVVPYAPAEAEAKTAQLETLVLEAFLSDKSLSTRSVDISSLGKGVIQLSGWVDSKAERMHATALARRVPGVVSVANELYVGDRDALDAEDLASRT